jgi:large subunit ribosomal protein L25
MPEAVINAEERKDAGSKACRQLRGKGMIPGIVYGHGQQGLQIAVSAHDFIQSLGTRAHMFDLKVEGRADEKVLVKDLQYSSMGDDVLHVDLQRIDLTETVEVMVPVLLTGHAVGVVIEKGVLDQPLRELRVRCLPMQIPSELRLAVSQLSIGMMLSVKDIALPEGVTAVNPPEQVVAVVHPPMAEEEVAPAAVAEEGAAEPEVIGAAEKEAAEGEEAEGGEGKEKPSGEKRAKGGKAEE